MTELHNEIQKLEVLATYISEAVSSLKEKTTIQTEKKEETKPTTLAQSIVSAIQQATGKPVQVVTLDQTTNQTRDNDTRVIQGVPTNIELDRVHKKSLVFSTLIYCLRVGRQVKLRLKEAERKELLTELLTELLFDSSSTAEELNNFYTDMQDTEDFIKAAVELAATLDNKSPIN